MIKTLEEKSLDMTRGMLEHELKRELETMLGIVNRALLRAKNGRKASDFQVRCSTNGTPEFDIEDCAARIAKFAYAAHLLAE
jgi:hypothetical protein